MLTREEESHVAEALARISNRAKEAIGSAPDAWRAITFVRSLHSSIDAASRTWEAGGENSECQPGCSHCCSAKVEVSDPEALYIANQMLGLPQSQLELISSRLRVNSELRASPGLVRVPCAFLDRNMCVIYEHRPSVCRKAHSLSVKACENQEATIPQSLGLALQHEVLIKGTNRGYVANGLPANINELSAAVLAVLENGVNAEDWYKGSPLLHPPAPLQPHPSSNAA